MLREYFKVWIFAVVVKFYDIVNFPGRSLAGVKVLMGFLSQVKEGLCSFRLRIHPTHRASCSFLADQSLRLVTDFPVNSTNSLVSSRSFVHNFKNIAACRVEAVNFPMQELP
jgi:hypothetical protein